MGDVPGLDFSARFRPERKEDPRRDQVLLSLLSFGSLFLSSPIFCTPCFQAPATTTAPVGFANLPSLDSSKKQEYGKNGTDSRRVDLGAARKETTMAATFTLSAHMEANIASLSKFWETPLEFFRTEVSGSTKGSKMMLFTTLAYHFRNDGNFSAAEQFLRYSMTLARDLFDDFNSPTTFQTGHAFTLLSTQLVKENFDQARHYVSFLFSFLFFFVFLSPHLLCVIFLPGRAELVSPYLTRRQD